VLIARNHRPRPAVLQIARGIDQGLKLT
jgi:hypothetical protein